MEEDKFEERMQFTADAAGGISALSRTSGVATRTIKGYIDGDNDPTRKKLIAMADAAKVSVEWLATGKGLMRQGETQGGKKCDHEALKLHRKGHLFEKDPGFNPELMEQIYSQLSSFKENNPGSLTSEKEIDVLILTYSLCQPRVRNEARLICSMVASIISGEHSESLL